MGEHKTTNIAFEADIRDGIGNRFIDHLNTTIAIDRCDSGYSWSYNQKINHIKKVSIYEF